MTVVGYDICEGSAYEEKDLTPEILPLAVVFPCQLCFSVHFLRKLFECVEIDRENTMAIATIIYIVVSSLATAFAFGNEIIEPMIQTKYNPEMSRCRTTRWFSWFIAGASYWALIEVFLCRLSQVFTSSSPYSLKPQIKYIFRVTFALTAITGGILFGFRSAFMNCWEKRTLSLLKHTPLFPDYVYFCNVNKKYLWIRVVASGLVLIVFSVSIIVLLYQFIWRLKQMDHMIASLGVASDQGFGNLITKSTLVACVGLSSTFTAVFVVGLTGYHSIVYWDFFLNNCLIYCLYQFGDDAYQFFFSGIVQCCFQNKNEEDSNDPAETSPLSYKASLTASNSSATPGIDDEMASLKQS